MPPIAQQFLAGRPELKLDALATEAALPFTMLCEEIGRAVIELDEGRIHCPPRQILPFGAGGQLSSLSAVGEDLGVHKLVTYLPQNPLRALPSIHSMVTAWDVQTGQLRAQLDGITVTTRRTAALSMLAMRLLGKRHDPKVALIGTGAQAAGHLQALAQVFPAAQVQVKGSSPQKTAQFCREQQASPIVVEPLRCERFEDIDVVIATTNSHAPVYHVPPTSERLLIGVGAFLPDMAEYARSVVLGSRLYIDEPCGGRLEAGDYLQAGVDWKHVSSLADASRGAVDFTKPRLFKCVGGAAFDLAAVRCALKNI